MKKSFAEMPEKFRDTLYQCLTFIYAIDKGIKNPEEKIKRKLERKKKTTRQWHTYCYWKLKKVEELREKVIPSSVYSKGIDSTSLKVNNKDREGIVMPRREKKERNKDIMRRIKKGDYQVDIAKDFNISPEMVSKIKKKYRNEFLAKQNYVNLAKKTKRN